MEGRASRAVIFSFRELLGAKSVPRYVKRSRFVPASGNGLCVTLYDCMLYVTESVLETLHQQRHQTLLLSAATALQGRALRLAAAQCRLQEHRHQIRLRSRRVAKHLPQRAAALTQPCWHNAACPPFASGRCIYSDMLLQKPVCGKRTEQKQRRRRFKQLECGRSCQAACTALQPYGRSSWRHTATLHGVHQQYNWSGNGTMHGSRGSG